MRKHLSFTLVAVVALSLLAAQPAAAAGPTTEPAPSDPISFAAGKVCDFPLTISVTRNQATITTFANGNQLIRGLSWNKITNDSTHRSTVEFDTSARIYIAYGPEGILVTAAGPSLLYFYAEDKPGKGLLRMNGLVVETATPDFTITSFRHWGGRIDDMCDNKWYVRGEGQG